MTVDAGSLRGRRAFQRLSRRERLRHTLAIRSCLALQRVQEAHYSLIGRLAGRLIQRGVRRTAVLIRLTTCVHLQQQQQRSVQSQRVPQFLSMACLLCTNHASACILNPYHVGSPDCNFINASKQLQLPAHLPQVAPAQLLKASTAPVGAPVGHVDIQLARVAPTITPHTPTCRQDSRVAVSYDRSHGQCGFILQAACSAKQAGEQTDSLQEASGKGCPTHV